MRKIKRRITWYKGLLFEIIETLCTICLYLESDGRYTRNEQGHKMRSHFAELKRYSSAIVSELYEEKEGGRG